MLPQKKRMHILYVISDVLATLSPTQLEIPKKKLVNIEIQAALDEIKHHATILAQLSACGTPQTKSSSHAITTTLISNWVNRRVFSVDEGQDLRTKIASRAEQDIATVIEDLQLDAQPFMYDTELAEEIVITRVLPSYHGVADDPSASWDTLPAMNGFYLKNTRGFPLRAGALQGGIPLRNAGE